ncbi:threonylcarbamoyl-AMP synthase [candidate division KSB1 bacterium]|nr:threonylcarbamoyl-AMP synthase [candidate division KSB1 bacterium]
MIRLEINADNPQVRYIEAAAEVLREGGLVIYPTDTVYGLGCDLFNKKAIERIYQLKGKKKQKRLSFICPDLKDIAKYAYVSNPAYKIMRHLLPGPYTFILEASRLVPKILLEKKKTIGIRVPDNVICQDLLAEFGNPVISTSASLPEQHYLNDPDEIADIFEHGVDLFLDNGFGGVIPSSIIDLSGEEPVVIREGKDFSRIFIGV